MAKRRHRKLDRSSIPSEEQGKPDGTVGESVWFELTRRFHYLATALHKPLPLAVREEFSGEDLNGTWVFPPPFLVLDRFEDVAKQAGKNLGAPEGVDPLCFWLDYVSFYLWCHAKGRGLRILDPVVNGVHHRQRVIDDVIDASEKFSIWLSNSIGNAVKVLTEKSSESPPWERVTSPEHSNDKQPSTGGDFWAAKRNREEEARARIVQALQELRVPYQDWPDFVQSWHADGHSRSKFSHRVTAPSFQPPDYDRLAPHSIDTWQKLADASWKQHRDTFIRGCKYWEEVGMDEKLPTPRKTRGPGQTQRNADLAKRYEWTALNLVGKSWKEIAFYDGARDPDEMLSRADTIRKAVNNILQVAQWPPIRK